MHRFFSVQELGPLMFMLLMSDEAGLRTRSFHAYSRCAADLHRADMACALHAASQDNLSREQIEHEILNGRDLSKKDPPLRQLAYAMRTASKAIALSAQ